MWRIFTGCSFENRHCRARPGNPQLVERGSPGQDRAGRTKRCASGSTGLRIQLRSGFPSADQNIVQIYAKNVLLPLAFLHAVDIRCGPTEFVPVGILQADTEIQPWPKRRAAVAERQIGKLEIQPALLGLADRHTASCTYGAPQKCAPTKRSRLHIHVTPQLNTLEDQCFEPHDSVPPGLFYGIKRVPKGSSLFDRNRGAVLNWKIQLTEM
jgi:hypothetical protein